ncbi:unnamed protein product [Candida verbasci]|uniref:SH3 domain-containing protein n=1 Tax=Candida verbasci TaxID=1227364 RepID=A0A9W4TWQ7_9ASCO|nr:unnamed protein product [Candida verbasci]
MVDKLTSNITNLSTNIGSHLKDAYHTTGNEFSNLTYNVKTHLPFMHKTGFDQDDEIIDEYIYNIKQSIKGLKFVINQHHVLGKKLFPWLISLNIKIATKFIQLIGPNSLYFKDIEKYYHEFDLFQSTQEIPHVHPKEQQYLVESVNSQLISYLNILEFLKVTIKEEWEINDEKIKIRTQQMNKYLKDTLKLISKRNKKKLETNKFEHYIEKLNQKTPPLSEKDQKHMDKYQEELNKVGKVFEFLNEKCLTIIPHIVLWLEEFVETITIMILNQQVKTYERLMDAFESFSLYFGLINDKIPEYQEIVEQWETDLTATRLTIESAINMIHDKNPNKLDEEIDDKDQTSNFNKFLSKWNNKILHERKHEVKSKNNNGVLAEIVEVNPSTYLDPKLNILDCYQPHKVVEIDEIQIPEVNKEAPPSLPPRTNTTVLKNAIPEPKPFMNGTTNQFYKLPDDSMESLLLSDEEADTDLISIKTGSSASSFSTQNDSFYHNENNKNSFERKLIKIYNNAKNEIQTCPITTKFAPRDTKNDLDLSSISHKLYILQSFFDKLPESTDKFKIAKADYEGKEPGDLSFKQDEIIEILLDFQDVDTLYQPSQSNWSIGKINDRIGFISNEYIE